MGSKRPDVLAIAAAGLSVTAVPTARAGGASETATYLMTFDATWSAKSHPDDFPPGAHFSALIGGTHDGTVAFWTEGEIASTGIEQMAEWGSKTALRNEVLAAIADGSAGEVVEGASGISSPGTTSVELTATQAFPLATIVTMIAPSPDWFVGTESVALFVNDRWVTELVVELYPYDAGTDSGVTYTSPNDDTQPPEPIAEITGYPFFNEDAGRVLPLGTYTFTRLDIPPCPADVDESGDVGVPDLLAVLSAWGPYDPCPPHIPEDFDEDCVVGVTELLAVLGSWGPCP